MVERGFYHSDRPAWPCKNSPSRGTLKQPVVEPRARGRASFSLPPALRYPAFRAYWLGMLASVSGYQVLQATQFWLVYTLKESPLFLGYVGIASSAPAIALNLFGGVIADKVDRRRLVSITQTVQAFLIFLLATLTLLDLVNFWHVLIIAFVAGTVDAVDGPARESFYPQLIERDAMVSAVAVISAIYQGTRIIAPAIAGAIIATAGTAAAFYVAGAGFLVMAAVIFSVRVGAAPPRASGSTAQNLLEVVNLIKNNSIYSLLIGMSFFNSFFGMSFLLMMPMFADEILGRGPEAYGVLLSAGGVGALLATVVMGSRSDIRRRGQLIIIAGILFGLSVAAFGLTSRYVGSFHLALALLFVIGIFNSTYIISILSSLQLMVPDHMRGRLMGFFGITWRIYPLGGMQAGVVGSLIGVPAAIAVGGLVVSAFAMVSAIGSRRLRNLGTALPVTEEPGIAARRTDGP